MKYIDNIQDFCIAVVPVGSRVTCNPPPMDTDQDLLCFCAEDDYDAFGQWLSKREWKYEDCYRLHGEFMSYRKEHWNVIATCDEKFFDNFMDATRSCKEKNLLKKEERIAEFDRIFGVKKQPKPTFLDDWADEVAQPAPPPQGGYQSVVYGPNGGVDFTQQQAAAVAQQQGIVALQQVAMSWAYNPGFNHVGTIQQILNNIHNEEA